MAVRIFGFTVPQIVVGVVAATILVTALIIVARVLLLVVAAVALVVGVGLLWLWWRGGPHRGRPSE